MTVIVSHRVNIDGFAHDPTLHVLAWPADRPIPALADRLDTHDTEGAPLRGKVIGRTWTDGGVTLYVEEARGK